MGFSLRHRARNVIQPSRKEPVVKSSTKVIVLGMAVLLGVAAANATSIDPTIIIRDPLGCPSGNCTPVGLTFGFTVPAAGTGLLHFLNVSGATWHSLLLTETGVAAVNITCSANVFSCAVVPFGQNGAKIVLTAINGLTGIPSGNSFEIILGCARGDCPKWPAGLDFEAVANVPEPGTMALVLTGLGAIFVRRKSRSLS
jgi:hypothetical protein